MRRSILSADIGGTNSRFAVHEIDEVSTDSSRSVLSNLAGTLILSKEYKNNDHESFDEVFALFLKEAGLSNEPPLTACIAVAGPVKDNMVRFTNRDGWIIAGRHIEEKFQIKSVQLVNDFLAAGYGLLTLNESTECVVLQEGTKNPSAPIACIGAGTGLGECFLTPKSQGEYTCYPSEGGHAEFAPRNELEFGLLRHLKKKFNQRHRVSVERIISGKGLENIYEYLAEVYPEMIDSSLHQQIEAAIHKDGAGKLIATNAGENELCRMTMDIFIEAYGAEAGVAALKWLPYGGLYLCGGLTPKNIKLITGLDGKFIDAFGDKGRVSGMLATIPVYAVMVENLGERGSHYLAHKMLIELEATEKARRAAAAVVAATMKEDAAATAAVTAASTATSLPFAHPAVGDGTATCPFSAASKKVCGGTAKGTCPIDAHCVMWSLVAAAVGATAAVAFMRLKR